MTVRHKIGIPLILACLAGLGYSVREFWLASTQLERMETTLSVSKPYLLKSGYWVHNASLWPVSIRFFEVDSPVVVVPARGEVRVPCDTFARLRIWSADGRAWMEFKR